MSTVTDVMSVMDSDLERVQPGQPVDMRALSCGDAAWQGDLGLAVISESEAGIEAKVAAIGKYREVKEVGDAELQLVPGNTQGAKHCLSHGRVRMWRPEGWGNADTTDSLAGPVFVAKEDVTVLHPTHGPVHVPAGMVVQCVYQREWDSEARRERRNAD